MCLGSEYPGVFGAGTFDCHISGLQPLASVALLFVLILMWQVMICSLKSTQPGPSLQSGSRH